jgi:aryl-alcohol dehydrogenase-like predicted oxidoreductase
MSKGDVLKQRLFGKTGFAVAEVGLGAWQLGGDWAPVSDDKAAAILTTAVDNGVNFIDTADVYGAGRSESLIGKVLKTRRERVWVATKLGRLHGYPDGYSLPLFRKCTEDSLRRLGVSALDLTQLHCIPTALLQNGEVFDWLRVLRDEGKIRYFGASVESMQEALICLEQDDLASLQIIFNVFRQKPIEMLFDKAKARDVALIIRLPLASGLLAGKFSRKSTFVPEDHRNYNRDGQVFNVGETFAGLPFETGVASVEALRAYVPAQFNMVQFALRWILDYDAVSVIIPGARSPEQVKMNISASRMAPISKEIHDELTVLYNTAVKQHIRGPY